ncbi:Flp pilus assembly protein CpaB [Pseudalkalibacillus berkeleyi]|uniref:Flp pilus assembly protein CpaB n=1 Tax=Pseudalkalibacillus berkeleyi TaxID=1069813 RepID=A0ABS9H0B2_9BACL|nr:Flp pilus assembly protein CpaB [Pseudalkalibacillus berkeleyi]MCF6137283.1 Flp pilus assembly protein CpaB [Pseudalkalibacillus berkeleyi]
MKTKQIWLTAIVFGLFAAGVLYFSIFKEAQPAATTVKDEQKQDEVKASEEKPKVNATTVTQQKLTISEGKRAISVDVKFDQGVSGNITVGSYVDVVYVSSSLGEHPDAENSKKDEAKLLLQNIKVLAIGHAADSEQEAIRYQTVTFEVTPQQGLTLGFATRGELHLMLRTKGDQKIEKEKLTITEGK